MGEWLYLAEQENRKPGKVTNSLPGSYLLVEIVDGLSDGVAHFACRILYLSGNVLHRALGLKIGIASEPADSLFYLADDGSDFAFGSLPCAPAECLACGTLDRVIASIELRLPIVQYQYGNTGADGSPC